MGFRKGGLPQSGLILSFLLLFIWWYGSEHGWWNTFLLPSPSRVASVFFTEAREGALLRHVMASTGRIARGFGFSAVLALTLAFFCTWFPWLLAQLGPLLGFFRHIPPMSVIPVLILWFGIGEAPKVILIIFAAFFPIFMSALQGINECDQQLVEIGKVFHCSRWQIFKFIVLPAAIPTILTGLRLGLGYSWRSLVAAELVAATSGLGYMILEAEQLSRSDVVIMGIFVIGVLGVFMDNAFLFGMRYYLRRSSLS